MPSLRISAFMSQWMNFLRALWLSLLKSSKSSSVVVAVTLNAEPFRPQPRQQLLSAAENSFINDRSPLPLTYDLTLPIHCATHALCLTGYAGLSTTITRSVLRASVRSTRVSASCCSCTVCASLAAVKRGRTIQGNDSLD